MVNNKVALKVGEMDSNCNYIDGGGVAACCYLNTGVYKKPGNMIFRSVTSRFSVI